MSDNKRFKIDLFRSELNYDLSKLDVCNSEFEHFFFLIFNEHVPMKTKHLRANEREFMNKELNRAIMTQSKLRNKYLKRKVLTQK